jgi:hypothetical protein
MPWLKELAQRERTRQRKLHELATTKAVNRPADFNFENHGSICLLRSLTPTAIEWVETHIGRNNGYQPQWPTVVIEPRYVGDVMDGITSDGLVVR